MNRRIQDLETEVGTPCSNARAWSQVDDGGRDAFVIRPQQSPHAEAAIPVDSDCVVWRGPYRTFGHASRFSTSLRRFEQGFRLRFQDPEYGDSSLTASG